MIHMGESSMKADTGGARDAGGDHQSAPYFGLTDLIFAVIAIVVATLVIRLGYMTWQDGSRTEDTKANGEAVATWMTEQGLRREKSEDTALSACNRGPGTWAQCREALLATGAPFASLQNAFSTKNLLFADACDRTRLDTHGSIILEKGTPKPPDGSSLAYTPLADEESLAEPLAIRVSICGRAFAINHIAEFKF
jgi:hypothetical protein